MTILHWAYQVESIVKKDEFRVEEGIMTFFPPDLVILILLSVNDNNNQLSATNFVPGTFYM